MKKIFWTLLLTMILAGGSQSQAASAALAAMGDGSSAAGFVRDSATGETLIGATVSILGAKRGAYTNKQGYYSITNVIPGEYTVRVTMVGYKNREAKLKFEKGNPIRMDFGLSSGDLRTGDVVVSADRDPDTRQISISTVNVPIAQIKEIRIGGESDVFRSLQMLPGVLTSSQMSSGLYIRGGSPDQNLVLLDGATVYNPSHLFGFISTFNSEAIKDVELIKGGYPAEYGSRLSSVINITQKDGNREEFGGVASLGLISSKISLEGPLGNGSYFIGGRRTYFDLIRPALDSDPEMPIPDFGFYDLNGKITQNFGQDDKVFLSGFLSKDNFNWGSMGLDMNLFMGNRAGSAGWTHIFAEDLFSTVLFSTSYYESGLNEEMNGFFIGVKNSITDYSIKGDLEWFLSDNATINSGLEVSNFIFNYDQNFTGSKGDAKEGTNEGGRMKLLYHDWVYSGYVQANYRPTELISLQFGLRGSWWNYSEHMNVDPRAAIRWQAQDNFAIKASWGIFHQYLRLAGDENFSLFDTWLPTDNTVKPSQAQHFILSSETKIGEFDFNADVYYKILNNISEVKTTSLSGESVGDVFYSGKGKAYGAEIFLQRRVGRLAGWIGYGLGWVRAQFDSVNDGREFNPKYDRRHDFKIVMQYELTENWQFGATFMFQTGQSYTGATSQFGSQLPGENMPTLKVIQAQRYGLRLPPSHQLNLNVNYSTKLFDLPFKMILDVFNVYNRRDILMRVYDVDYSRIHVEDVKLLPVLPTLSFEVKF
ncbi:MAG: TonB-dependent receptor [Chloroflexota bacterium]